jgi:hypothetical protein
MRRRLMSALFTSAIVLAFAAPAVAGPPERTPEEPQGCENQQAGPLEGYCEGDDQ